MPGRPRHPPFGDEIVGYQDDAVHLRDGSVRAVIATSSLNFLALAPEQQARSVQAFRDLLHAETGPMQIYLRIRRVPPGGGDAGADPDPSRYPQRRGYLQALTDAFIRTHLEDVPVFRRELFLVLGSLPTARNRLRTWAYRFVPHGNREDPAMVKETVLPLTQRVYRTMEYLRLIGVRARRLTSPELAQLFDGLYGRSQTAAPDASVTFHHRMGEVEVQGRVYASMAVERFPGEEITPGWLLPLIDFKGELHAAIHLVPLETDRMLGLLTHKIHELRADQVVSDERATVEATSFT
ncbi:MAG TPA: hypothetical protein VET65_08870, partial [Candidatus Limnocylindrales bacterium]|nr:hypothetical protein [Candidatus Limnocylindrales bacterium]